MPSPFPGMDPWLERPALFPDLHNSLLYVIRAAIRTALPAGYTVAGNTRVYVDFESRRIPDVGIHGPDFSSGHDTSGGVATLAPADVLTFEEYVLQNDPLEEPYLEIRSEDDDERLVTAIEVVSPTNKKSGSDGRTSYKNKQMEFTLAGVNLVEIDLLRGGPHTTAVPEAQLLARRVRFDYHICTSVRGTPRQMHVKPIQLADPLPTIDIPLDPGVPMVKLDLQAVFTRCYDECGFATLAKYRTKPADPPLTTEQQTWADGILKARGI